MDKKPKPVYLTKEERTALAIKARQLEVTKKKELEKKKIENHNTEITETERREIHSRYNMTAGKLNDLTEGRSKKREKKLQFEWSTQDDTSLSLDQSQTSEIQVSSSKRQKADPIESEKHWSIKPLADMTERDWRICREDYNISIKGATTNIPRLLRSFHESTLPPNVLNILKQVGYKEPTAIQRQAIPIGLSGRDMIGLAETGSGKTLAFLLPLIAYILAQPKLDEDTMLLGPYALVLVPTRELAQQIEAEARRIGGVLAITSISIVGGHDIMEQSFSLRNGAEIVIATPGRLRDCLEKHIIVLGQCHTVVMDEADRMIDLGFEPDVNFILDSLPPSQTNTASRQMMMFSATMPKEVELLARKYLEKPITVIVGSVGQSVESINQRVEFIRGSEDKKQSRLLELLTKNSYKPPIIVFVNQKITADFISKLLDGEGFKSVCLHGGKSQDQREASLSLLKSSSRHILVATDVAARGLDIKDVSLVVNYDMPKSIESYTHRIGRTGRAGQKGTSITFITSADQDMFKDLKAVLVKSRSEIPHELHASVK